MYFGRPDSAGTFGDMFGAANSLFSGIALAMAIYSMILQQRQAEQFEVTTVALLKQQAESLTALKASLDQQIETGRVAALIAMVDHQDQRIEQLRNWGTQSHQDANYYLKGIQAAERRIEQYQNEIIEIGTRKSAQA